MRSLIVSKEEARIAFAKRAAEMFRKNPELVSYTDNEIVPECLFAVRHKENILVLKLDEDDIPTTYEGLACFRKPCPKTVKGNKP